MSFYDDVLREIVAAVGAALFLGNLIALLRRRSDRRRASQRAVARGRPGSPVRSKVAATRNRETLPEAPLTRTVLYLVIGFVVMVAGLAAMATK
ncbi:MAG TPA: hypothetical protein VKH36_08650 [Acidimicrobiia bacterium]|nr:hypothetical protein [Acidimicrobiia bacterium]